MKKQELSEFCLFVGVVVCAIVVLYFCALLS